MDQNLEHQDAPAANGETAADAAHVENADQAPETAPVEAAPEAAPASNAPESAISADLRELVDQEISSAKDAAKAEIDTAVAAAAKMLQIAAGDTDKVLTDAEAAGVQLVAHNAGPYAGAVLSYASSVLGGTVNPIVEDAVKKGLAYAGAWLALLQANVEKGL